MNYKTLDSKDLKEVVGGKYYGNGVSCNKKGKCTVNWNKTAKCMGNIMIASVAKSTIGKC